MMRFIRIGFLVAAIAIMAGCYTLIKQPRGSREPQSDRLIVRQYDSETLLTTTTSLPWSEVGVGRTVAGARELMSRLQPDSVSMAAAMSTDFLRQMLVTVSWGVSPPSSLVIEDVTSAGGKLHIFVRALYPNFQPTRPPAATVSSPVVVVRVPAHNGNIVMHMASRYAWSEADRRWIQAPTQWAAVGDLDRIRVEFVNWDAEPVAAEDYILD